MAVCALCGAPFFAGQPWGDMTCADCIAAQVEMSLAAQMGVTLLGPMKPAKRSAPESPLRQTDERSRRAASG